MRVLLVEDNNEIRSMFLDLLMDRGHSVVAVDSAEKGILAVKAGSPFHAIVTDFNMPGLSGLGFLEILKELDVTCPKFMCSASIEEEVPLKAKALGAQFFDKMEFRKILDILSLKA